jgi:NitT/TauT family transport system substrate-binding protein
MPSIISLSKRSTFLASPISSAGSLPMRSTSRLAPGPSSLSSSRATSELAVAAMANQPELLVLITPKDGPVKTVADLKGKLISVSTVGSLTAWFVEELSQQLGCGSNKIKMVELGSDPLQVTALRTHQTNGMVTDIATALKLQEDGVARIVVHFGNIVPDFHIHIIYASNKIIAAHPDNVRAFLAGWFETIAFMKANKHEAVRRSVAYQRRSRAKSTTTSCRLFRQMGDSIPRRWRRFRAHSST